MRGATIGRTAVRGLLDLVYPRRCFACDAALPSRGPVELCSPCRAALTPLLNPCPRCASPRAARAPGRRCDACRSLRPGFRAAAAAVEYEGTAGVLIRRLKYGGQRAQAFVLGDLLAPVLGDAPFAGEIEAVVPIPLARVRLRERGFNQAALIALEVAGHLRKPFRDRWLRRVHETVSQAGLSRAARLRNLEGCFRARARAVRGRTILLVDDVLTTGTTLSVAARTLRRAGARRVYAAAVARV